MSFSFIKNKKLAFNYNSDLNYINHIKYTPSTLPNWYSSRIITRVKILEVLSKYLNENREIFIVDIKISNTNYSKSKEKIIKIFSDKCIVNVSINFVWNNDYINSIGKKIDPTLTESIRQKIIKYLGRNICKTKKSKKNNDKIKTKTTDNSKTNNPKKDKEMTEDEIIDKLINDKKYKRNLMSNIPIYRQGLILNMIENTDKSYGYSPFFIAQIINNEFNKGYVTIKRIQKAINIYINEEKCGGYIITIKGRINGYSISRSETINYKKVDCNTLTNNIQVAQFTHISKKTGCIGIKVIMNILPKIKSYNEWLNDKMGEINR